MQLTAVTRQAAAAAQSHAQRLRETEAAADAEISRVKSDASAVIQALMQENGRLKQMSTQFMQGPSVLR